jgi:F0F1-type ATP synthase assembly protein I
MRAQRSEPREPSQTPLSIGVAWASRITSLALEFVVPTLAGYWVDGKLGSRPWGILVGMVLGFTLGMLHLLQIARGGTKPAP